MRLKIATGSYHNLFIDLYIGLGFHFCGGLKSYWKTGGQFDRLTTGITTTITAAITAGITLGILDASVLPVTAEKYRGETLIGEADDGSNGDSWGGSGDPVWSG